jgi:Fe-S cluster biogenesis protein NfuA
MMDETQRRNLLERIARAIDDHVRPELRRDGGDIELVGVDDDRIVQVRLLGSCGACSSSVYTVTTVAEQALKAHVPEVRFVEAVP